MASPSVSPIMIYGTGSADTNGLATVVIPSRSTIVGVQWATYADTSTDNASYVFELSTQSTRQNLTNGAQGIISIVSAYNNLVTSGLTLHGINLFVPVRVPVIQGQIIYLHLDVTGAVTAVANVLLWF